MIRVYTDSDWAGCVRLFCSVFNDKPWHERWTLETASKYVNDILETPGFIGFVAYSGNELNGLILGNMKYWWQGKQYTIEEMCVRQEAQRSGVGSMLMSYAKAELRSAGAGRIQLMTSKGVPAEQFYLNNGFTEIEHMRMYTAKL